MSVLAFAIAAAMQAPADLDTLIKDLYAVISGPAGQARDWSKFRAMFMPDARMGVVGGGRVNLLSPEDYAKRAGPQLEKDGFFENETKRRVELQGELVHVWSTYASFRRAEDKEPFDQGVNSIQLVKTKEGWRILNIIWTRLPKG